MPFGKFQSWLAGTYRASSSASSSCPGGVGIPSLVFQWFHAKSPGKNIWDFDAAHWPSGQENPSSSPTCRVIASYDHCQLMFHVDDIILLATSVQWSNFASSGAVRPSTVANLERLVFTYKLLGKVLGFCLCVVYKCINQMMNWFGPNPSAWGIYSFSVCFSWKQCFDNLGLRARLGWNSQYHMCELLFPQRRRIHGFTRPTHQVIYAQLLGAELSWMAEHGWTWLNMAENRNCSKTALDNALTSQTSASAWSSDWDHLLLPRAPRIKAKCFQGPPNRWGDAPEPALSIHVQHLRSMEIQLVFWNDGFQWKINGKIRLDAYYTLQHYMSVVLRRLQFFVSQKTEAAAVMKRSFALPWRLQRGRWIKQCFGLGCLPLCLLWAKLGSLAMFEAGLFDTIAFFCIRLKCR